MSYSLVLGGGGVTGIAWETGLLKGLSDGGVDLTVADVIIGTSAGAVVGAQIATGVPLNEWIRRQLLPVDPAIERAPDLGLVTEFFAAAGSQAASLEVSDRPGKSWPGSALRLAPPLRLAQAEPAAPVPSAALQERV